MKKVSRLIALLAVFAVPLLAAAQTGINIAAIKEPYSDKIIYVINYLLVPVLMAIAFIVFLWGVYRYFIQEAANESEKAEGRMFALWGIIGFVIILSLWGIVNLVMGTLGLSVGKAPPYPTIGGSAPAANTTGGANQAASGGCSSAGPACNFGGVSGTCTQSSEGGFYCKQ